MASKYLEQMAHDKHFLISLCKDERLMSANKQGSKILYELANKARADVEKRQVCKNLVIGPLFGKVSLSFIANRGQLSKNLTFFYGP